MSPDLKLRLVQKVKNQIDDIRVMNLQHYVRLVEMWDQIIFENAASEDLYQRLDDRAKACQDLGQTLESHSKALEKMSSYLSRLENYKIQ
jgi:hypothetical protein